MTLLIMSFLQLKPNEIHTTNRAVSLVILNNGYSAMPHPIRLPLNPSILPPRVIEMIGQGLVHWKTGQTAAVQDCTVAVTVDGKTIDIYCRAGG